MSLSLSLSLSLPLSLSLLHSLSLTPTPTPFLTLTLTTSVTTRTHCTGTAAPFKGATDKVKIQIACFLHRELPIRLAHRAANLANTEQFKGNKHVENVISWYRTSFKALRACAAPTDIAKEEVFAKTLMDMYDICVYVYVYVYISLSLSVLSLILTTSHLVHNFYCHHDYYYRYERHSHTLITMAMAAHELRR